MVGTVKSFIRGGKRTLHNSELHITRPSDGERQRR